MTTTDDQEIVIRDPAPGANQLGVRDHNERLVLSLIQRHGSLASADIARRARLSPQTVSVIIRALEADGLLVRGEPQRGKVGKPLTPMALRAEGVLSIGCKIGRRSFDMVLMDLHGRLRRHVARTYPYPTPEAVLGFLRQGLAEVDAGLSADERRRIAGIGIASPFELWNWLETVSASEAEMEAWRHIDFATEIARFTDLRVHVSNDATAACAAEHLFGRGREFADYAYFFVGYFVGGGVVLNDAVYPGRSGNAGAFGTMPVRDTSRPGHQLIHNASLYLLERALADAGRDPMRIWREPDDWSGFEPQLSEWISHAARHLAIAAVAASSVIDFEAILIDGGFPASVRTRLVQEVDRAIDPIDCQGIMRPQVQEARAGAQARVIGAASLPLTAEFLLTGTGFSG
ncbi:MAG: ROK family transcriptional regulator [Pseudomonadota bacterium]